MTIQELFIMTWGRNPKVPEIEFTEETFIKKFGYDKTKLIFKKAVLEGFKKLTTLWDSLDEQGNIRPKDWQQKIINSTYRPAEFNKENLCECGCRQKAVMKIGDHPTRRYNVATRECFEKRIKAQMSESFSTLGDVLRNFNI